MNSIINNTRDLIKAVKWAESDLNKLMTDVRRLSSAKASITQPIDNQLLTWDEDLSMVINSLWLLPAADGAANELLYTDGAGNLGWIAGGVAAVAGADTQIQYNQAGVMGAEAAFTYNYNTNTMTADSIRATIDVSPNVADGATLGTAALEFSDLYLADESVIYFGDDQDITLTHVHNTGLSLNGNFDLNGNDLILEGDTYIHESVANTIGFVVGGVAEAGLSVTSFTIQHDLVVDSDADGLIIGEGQDAIIYYNGTDLVFNSQLVGAGDFYFENGDVGIATAAPLGRLDVCYGGMTIFLGADSDTVTRTDDTIKHARSGSIQYDIDEEGACIFYCYNDSDENRLHLGGGTSHLNAVTMIRFYTAANHTTTTGTERMRIDNNGRVFMYNLRSGATQAAAGAIADELWFTSGHATLPDNVLMIGA